MVPLPKSNDGSLIPAGAVSATSIGCQARTLRRRPGFRLSTRAVVTPHRPVDSVPRRSDRLTGWADRPEFLAGGMMSPLSWQRPWADSGEDGIFGENELPEVMVRELARISGATERTRMDAASSRGYC